MNSFYNRKNNNSESSCKIRKENDKALEFGSRRGKEHKK